MKACFILVTLQLRALKGKSGFSPVFATQYHNFLFSSSLTTLGKTGQQNEGVEFRRKPETPQAEPLRPGEGRGHGSQARPGSEARRRSTQPAPDPGWAASPRPPQAPEAKGEESGHPSSPPSAPRPHGAPAAPGRRCRPYCPHSSQLPPTWRRPWPPGAGPG